MQDSSGFIQDIQSSVSSPGRRRIASGGTSDLFLETIGNRLYIRKVLKDPYRLDPRFSDLLVREFETGQTLDHPHIVRYLYLDKGPFPPECVLEYVDGLSPTLFLRGQKNPASALSAYIRLLKQWHSALVYLQWKGVQHADLKPDNLLVDAAGNLKILDFGHARAANLIPLKGGTPGFSLEDKPESEIQALFASLKFIVSESSNLPAWALPQPPADQMHGPEYLKKEIRKLQFRKNLWPLAFFGTFLIAITVASFFVFKSDDAVLNTPKPILPEKEVLVKTEKAPSEAGGKNQNPGSAPVAKSKKTALPEPAFVDRDERSGALFWDILQQRSFQKEDLDRYKALRFQIIDSCYQNWKKDLRDKGLEENSPEFLRRQKSYYKGYYKAWKKSEQKIEQLFY